jgi:predicted nuclease of restriction endonuclease-like RecB superfamily
LVERLFADLRANERLVEMKKLSSQALLDRYDVALAQGVLLRAIRVQIALDGEDPGKVRQLFRAARFHGLMHRVRQLDEHRYLIELDGPFSIFSAVQKYGIKLAMFLPALLRCTRWRLRADIAWGKAKTEAVFELGPDDGLVPYDRSVSGVAPALAELIEGFRKLDCAWSVEANEHIFALPGEVVCVPDLVFSNAETGEQVFLEAFGFWSRTAVWQRIETLQSGFPSRILLAVGKQLRVSEEALGDDTPGELYVYKTSMRPKEILRRLESDG